MGSKKPTKPKTGKVDTKKRTVKAVKKKEAAASTKAETVREATKTPQTKKSESVREAYDRLKPKWTSGRAKNFKRWALQYRDSSNKEGKATA